MRPNPANLQANSPIFYEVGAVAKLLEGKFSEVWRRMSTKFVRDAGNYYSPKSLAVGLTGAIVEARAGHMESNISIIAGQLEKHDFPTYYVVKPLFDAIKRTHPPEGRTWDDVNLPYPAIAYMLPKGSLREPEPFSKEVVLVGVARLDGGTEYPVPTSPSIVVTSPGNRIVVFWLLAPSCLEMQDTTFPTDQTLSPDPAWIDAATGTREYNGPSGHFSAYVAGLVANLVLAQQARPELVEPGRCIERKRNAVNVWSPTYLGKKYVVQQRNELGKSKFTELGWRAGHFKQQHYGEGGKQVKTIWIEPYIAHTRGLISA